LRYYLKFQQPNLQIYMEKNLPIVLKLYRKSLSTL